MIYYAAILKRTRKTVTLDISDCIDGLDCEALKFLGPHELKECNTLHEVKAHIRKRLKSGVYPLFNDPLITRIKFTF